MGRSYEIPEDLLIQILSWLPVNSLLRFKCVSKLWRDLIISQEFVKLHLKRSQEADSGGNVILYSGSIGLHSFDFHNPSCRAIELHCPDLFKYQKKSNHDLFLGLVGSSNGLLCFFVNPHFVLYNPATRSCKNIPKIKPNYNGAFYYHLKNFSYDGVCDDYKILLITKSFCPSNSINGDEFHVYSIRANLWKSVKYPYGDTLGYGVVVNNMLHLIDYGDKVIRSFDLNNERFILGLSLPREVTSSSSLAFLNGHWHLHVGPCDIRIWKNDCWTTLFHSYNGYSSPYWDKRQYAYGFLMLAYHTKDGNRSLIGWEPYERHFLFYDLKYQQTSTIHVPGLPDTTIHVRGLSPDHVSKQIVAKPWVASLVSLND